MKKNSNKNNIYFASDFHLGHLEQHNSLKRERLVIKWLDFIKSDAKKIYLLGDIFDFWFEYKKVVPKGNIRFLAKLAEIIDDGTEVHIYVGNHDLWMRDYLEHEIGVKIHHKSKIVKADGLDIFISHGDGLGKGDYFYKFLKKIFTSSISKFLLYLIHPDLGLSIAHKWSKLSRKKITNKHTSKKNEILYLHSCELQKKYPIDFYIFGHRHLPLEMKIDEKAKYINLGDWISHFTYAKIKNGKLELVKFKI